MTAQGETDPEAQALTADDRIATLVEILQSPPRLTGNLSNLLGEHPEFEQLLGGERVSPVVLTLIGKLIERSNVEREASIRTLQVYKDQTARLEIDVSEARAELIRQVDAARTEREHIMANFIDRVDELSAKISTSAGRYTAQLAEKETLLKEAEKRAEVLAEHVADAQSVISEMRTSRSWRLTAPLRLLSRVLSRSHGWTVVEPDNHK
jgi:DNA repair exonuclease SbcCD ATPase subunit